MFVSRHVKGKDKAACLSSNLFLIRLTCVENENPCITETNSYFELIKPDLVRSGRFFYAFKNTYVQHILRHTTNVKFI